ncbi:glutamine-rich factor 1, partial [Armillaria solidipes]
PHSRERPDITYVAIIKQAILSSPDRRLSLSEIYEWITTVYPFFSPATKSWKNSIRHTLSSYQCFRNEAHGIWAIDDVELESYGNGSLQKRDSS